MPGMHRLDWLSSITWDGLTRMQLVCAFPHPQTTTVKTTKAALVTNRSTPSGFKSEPYVLAVGPGPYGTASGSGPGPRFAS